MKDKEKEKTTLKITNQRRVRGGGMAYGLKCEGVHLLISVSPRTSDADLDEWLVQARADRALEEPIVLEEWGPTRADALRAVGRSWDSLMTTHGLRMFDWEAVARVLTEVRAL